MKIFIWILIWLIFILYFGCVNAFFLLGGLPTLALTICTCYAAQNSCKALEKNHGVALALKHVFTHLSCLTLCLLILYFPTSSMMKEVSTSEEYFERSLAIDFLFVLGPVLSTYVSTLLSRRITKLHQKRSLHISHTGRPKIAPTGTAYIVRDKKTGKLIYNDLDGNEISEE